MVKQSIVWHALADIVQIVGIQEITRLPHMGAGSVIQQKANKQKGINMEEKKVAKFWEAEKELTEILLSMKTQLDITHQALSAQMPKLQELFLQLTQLGTELGYSVDNLDVKRFYDRLNSNELFHQVADLIADTVDSASSPSSLG